MCKLCVFSLSDGSEMGIVYMCESISVYELRGIGGAKVCVINK